MRFSQHKTLQFRLAAIEVYAVIWEIFFSEKLKLRGLYDLWKSRKYLVKQPKYKFLNANTENISTHSVQAARKGEEGRKTQKLTPGWQQ